MSLPGLLRDPKKREAALADIPFSKEDVEGGLAALSYANGVITAVVVGPEHVPASEWLPLIVNSADSSWSNEEGFLAEAAMLFERRKIIGSLRSGAGEYEPFFWENDEGDLNTCDWAEGFLAGIRVREKEWKQLQEREAQWLTSVVSILLQDEQIDARIKEEGFDPEAVFQDAVAELPGLIAALYTTRREAPAEAAVFRELQKRAGRSAPCPCGSGRRYKKCCLN